MIRTLRPGEAPPETEPKRYVKGKNRYHVLRWKVGRGEYVETYERDATGAIIREVPPAGKRIDFAAAFDLYAEGKTLTEVGGILGCDPAALSRVFARNGVTTRTSRDYRNPGLDADEIERCYVVDRLGIVQVARRMGVTPKLVRRVLDERGVPAKPPGNTTRCPDGPTYEAEFRRARTAIYERSGRVCEARVIEVCTGRAQHVHHRKLRSQGGDNVHVNLLDVCEACHTWAHHHPARAVELGIIVPSWSDPSTTPVRARQSASWT